MNDPFNQLDEMDEVTAQAWQFYLAIAELALKHLQTFPAGSIALPAAQEVVYWVWQGKDQPYLAWAPVADEMVYFDNAALLVETLGLSAEEINYRREGLTHWLQSAEQSTLQWPKAQLQQAIRPPDWLSMR
jgi:hypothetical protein